MGIGTRKGAGEKLREKSGQMTIELMVMLPVLIAVAAIAVNALLLFSECASFDRLARNAVRVHATSPAYGQGVEQSCALIQGELDKSFDKEYLNVEVSVEGNVLGHATYVATLDFSPTLFGMGLRSEVLGVSLPHMKHSTKITVDTYKPGVLF